MNNIVIFNDYIEKKKYFIKSKLICENTININNMNFYFSDIDIYNNPNYQRNKKINLNEKFKIFIN